MIISFGAFDSASHPSTATGFGMCAAIARLSAEGSHNG